MREIEKGVWLVWKDRGETPLQAIDRLRHGQPHLSNEKMTYAGRLDPAAEGLLLILVGARCKDKENYLSLNKVYEFEIIFGITTDTGDLLGIPYFLNKPIVIDMIKMQQIAHLLIGRHIWPYSAYSSKTYAGKSLWELSREGKYEDLLERNQIPLNEFTVYDLKPLDQKKLTSYELLSQVQSLTTLIKGDFRQPQIVKRWQEVLTNDMQMQWPIIRFTVTCSTGTYVRQLAERLGSEMASAAATISIRRTKIFLDKDSHHL